jgi:hypothetical protein
LARGFGDDDECQHDERLRAGVVDRAEIAVLGVEGDSWLELDRFTFA